ncbi:MAG: glycosyltransferase, partial [Kordiimonas sp.]
KTARGIQNKVLEAMATSKAIVVTSLANEGINAVGGESLEVADTEKQFADAVLKLLDDPGMRKSMGSRARKFVEREFTWGQAFEKLDSLIGECL